MSAFSDAASAASPTTSQNLEQMAIKLHTSVKNSPPRGGSSVVEVQGSILMFGGADREQVHYQDLVVYQRHRSDGKSSYFDKVMASGDVPMPRSGHGMVSYGKYAFVFGGIDFAEEVAYNDLYLLNTENWEWSYIGESGVEITGRNSHSFCILSNSTENYLVIYGGASPEHGPLDDVIYAKLPSADTIDPKSFYVEWKKFEVNAGGLQPGAREMHSTCSAFNYMVITGGRDEQGQVLSDVWALVLNETASNSSSSSSSSAAHPFVWQKWEDLALPSPRCAHVASFISQPKNANELLWRICLFGGFTLAGVSSDVLYITVDLTRSEASDLRIQPAIGGRWEVAAFANTGPKGRFGHTLCSLSYDYILELWNNSRYRPLLEKGNVVTRVSALESQSQSQSSAAATLPSSNYAAAFLYGGVNVEEDFADIWILFM